MKDTIVLYTSPGRGHLNSMVELGKLILTYHPCFSIDIIIPTAPFVTNSRTDDCIASVFAAATSVTFHQLPPVSGLPDTLRHQLTSQPYCTSLGCWGKIRLLDHDPPPPLLLDHDPSPPRLLDHELSLMIFQVMTQTAKSAGLIVNTFELLEERAIKAMLEGQRTPGETLPPLYCIGLVVGGGNGENRGRDRHECLSWLDSKPSRSVLFLCFGSLGSFSTPDGVENRSSLESLLPEGFLDRTKDRGLVVESWAPQVEVLNHESVGGFVTHCGWTSVLEGVCAGVPMLAWPLYAEQKMIKAVVVEEMKVGLAVTRSEEGDGLVSSAELEQRVSELMDSEKGRAVKERAVAMKEAAAAAMRDGGSSRVALDNLVESFKRGCMAPLG
ncbi:hypothetical protein WN944_025030 [Citrus x changshan-huyou]|uniref:Glycosyltransferase n=1 Tax=Citrus x changshan-huyou TaxID=2935761 RepID=A0AAP0LPZ6_9ROSI